MALEFTTTPRRRVQNRGVSALSAAVVLLAIALLLLAGAAMMYARRAPSLQPTADESILHLSLDGKSLRELLDLALTAMAAADRDGEWQVSGEGNPASPFAGKYVKFADRCFSAAADQLKLQKSQADRPTPQLEAEALSDLAWWKFLAARDAGKAKPALEDAAKLDPTNFRIPVMQGYVELVQGEASTGSAAAAIPYFQKAIVLNPNSADAHIDLGQCYALQRNPDQAWREYQEVLRPGASMDPFLNGYNSKVMEMTLNALKKGLATTRP